MKRNGFEYSVWCFWETWVLEILCALKVVLSIFIFFYFIQTDTSFENPRCNLKHVTCIRTTQFYLKVDLNYFLSTKIHLTFFNSDHMLYKRNWTEPNKLEHVTYRQNETETLYSAGAYLFIAITSLSLKITHRIYRIQIFVGGVRAVKEFWNF